MAISGLWECGGRCGSCVGLGGLADGGIGRGDLSHCRRGCPGCRARGLHRRSSRLLRHRPCSGLSGGKVNIPRHIGPTGLPCRRRGIHGIDRHMRCHGPVGIHHAARGIRRLLNLSEHPVAWIDAPRSRMQRRSLPYSAHRQRRAIAWFYRFTVDLPSDCRCPKCDL